MKKTLRLIAALAVLCAISGHASAGIHDGLLNYWNLDGDFNDTAGDLAGNTSSNADTGSQPAANVSFGQWTDLDPDAGALGQYGIFDGTADAFVEVPDSADIVAAGESLSISAWFNVNQFDQGWQGLVAHGEGSDYRIARRGGGSNIMSYAGGTGDIPGADDIGPDVNDGNWHHVVSISPFGAPAELWVDGVQVATGGDTALTDNGSGRLMIGGNPDTAGDGFRTWDGAIEDIGMWDRALNGGEINAIYNSGAAGIPLSGVSYSRFCESSTADVCYDFDAADEGVAVYGDGEVRTQGGLEGGYLKVTDAANGQRGKVIVPDSGIGGQFVFGGRTGGANAAHHIDNLEASVTGGTVDISAQLRVGGGTDSPADGFSFNFVREGDPVLAEDTNGFTGIAGEDNLPEEGTTTGISIGFDEWQSGPNAQETGNYTTDDIIGISLRIDGELIGQAPLTTLNGELSDVTSLQTGPNDDGINNLGWAQLTINAPLEGANLENTVVTWKGERVEFVPEPASGVLALIAIGSLLMFRRKK